MAAVGIDVGKASLDVGGIRRDQGATRRMHLSAQLNVRSFVSSTFQ